VVNKSNVVHLGQVRDLDRQWNEVRKEIISGHIKGFQLSLIGPTGKETIYVAGKYREHPHLATRAALRMSAARAFAEDEPPKLTGTE
jgi:hypothetical protein